MCCISCLPTPFSGRPTHGSASNQKPVVLRCASGALVDSEGETGTSRNGRLRFEQPGPAVRIHLAPPRSPRFSGSLRKNRKYCACSRSLFDLRAPEKLTFGRQLLIYARFSLSRTEPVPFAPSFSKKSVR